MWNSEVGIRGLAHDTYLRREELRLDATDLEEIEVPHGRQSL
jgi:hypothetical protein